MPEDRKIDYWAAESPLKLSQTCMRKVEDYFDYLRTSGRLSLYQRMYEYYYRPAMKLGRMQRGGEQGEYTILIVNHFRNVLQHLYTMTTSQRPALDPQASNTDEKSLAQTILGRGLLDYYLKVKKIEWLIADSVEWAILLGESFIQLGWDANKGEEFAVNQETGSIIREGDVSVNLFTPFDYVRDWQKLSPNQDTWGVSRDFQNRYELMAKFPEHAERIKNLSWDKNAPYDWRPNRLWSLKDEDTDDIPIYEFRHNKTQALPQGRVLTFLDTDLWLTDGPLPYEDMLTYRVAASEQKGTPFGYTVGFDLLPIQEANDMVISAAATNVANHAVTNLTGPKGSGVEPRKLSEGMNYFEYDQSKGRIEVLNLLQMSPQVFDFIQLCEQWIQTISAVNSVVRGNPEASLKSGSALALVASMAIQFSADLQKSYVAILEDVGMGLLSLFQTYITEPRIVAITGKNNKQYAKEFTGQDIKGLKRVTCDIGNPIMRTQAGKTNMADMLLEKGLIQNPDQYIQMLTTGRPETMYQGPQSELNLIAGENEKLSEGKQVKAAMTDRHDLHVPEHKAVISSPEARDNPQIVMATLQHIQEHIDLYKSMDPLMASLLKMQPVSAPPSQGSSPDMNAQGQSEMAQLQNPTAPIEQKAAKVRQPNMPSPPPNTPPENQAIIAQMGTA